jgi:hypothetical protein
VDGDHKWKLKPEAFTLPWKEKGLEVQGWDYTVNTVVTRHVTVQPVKLPLAENFQIYLFRNSKRTTGVKCGDPAGQIFGSKSSW